MKVKAYISNCFLLLIPIFVWNILLVEYLPEQFSPELFDKRVPSFLILSENILRGIVFVLPLIMRLHLKTRRQKIGLLVYLLGITLYFSSWLILIFYPNSEWSTSVLGFTAPAYTTSFWFLGIGLIGDKTFFNFPKTSIVFILSTLAFVVVHTSHAYLAFQNN